MADAGLKDKLRQVIRDYPDFPKPGILFRDAMPVLLQAQLVDDILSDVVLECEKRNVQPDVVVAMEARGFLMGPSLALKMRLPFVPIRKPGKLPGKLASVPYEKEYGKDVLEMQSGVIPSGANVLLVDDVLATGGTAEAAVKLIRSEGANVSLAVFLADLRYLGGYKKLKDTPYYALLEYQS